MLTMMKLFSVLAFLVGGIHPSRAQSSCYERQSLQVPESYKINFSKDYELKPVASNNNWYAQVQAGWAFGCVIFAVSQTEGRLKGVYRAVSAERLNSKCEGKQDYVYTQFVDAEGRRTFRLQCERAVYEDGLPQAFAPTFEQASQLNFEKRGERTATVVR